MKNDSVFTTMNAYQGAWLKYRGHDYWLKVNDKRRVVIVFDDSDKLRADLVDFTNGANCDVKRYTDEIRSLKSSLYSRLEST
jgi:hypothetical protein